MFSFVVTGAPSCLPLFGDHLSSTPHPATPSGSWRTQTRLPPGFQVQDNFWRDIPQNQGRGRARLWSRRPWACNKATDYKGATGGKTWLKITGNCSPLSADHRILGREGPHAPTPRLHPRERSHEAMAGQESETELESKTLFPPHPARCGSGPESGLLRGVWGRESITSPPPILLST